MDEGFGPHVKRLREARGLSQAELARRSDVQRAYLSQIESGGTKLPGAGIRRRLAAALGVTHADLLVAAGELLPEEVARRQAGPELSPAQWRLLDATAGLSPEAIALLVQAAEMFAAGAAGRGGAAEAAAVTGLPGAP